MYNYVGSLDVAPLYFDLFSFGSNRRVDPHEIVDQNVVLNLRESEVFIDETIFEHFSPNPFREVSSHFLKGP